MTLHDTGTSTGAFRRKGRRAALVGSVVLALIALLSPSPARASGPIPVTSFPALTVATTAYPIPTGAIFVAPTGSDANAGGLSTPVATLARAVAIAPAGNTIVLRAGTYRESISSIWKRLTIQAYPNEQVWLKGSKLVSGFAPSGSAWVKTGWTSSLCSTCYDPAAIDPAYPNAGLPDMVFVNGAPMRQLATRAEVVAGTFFVDRPGQALYLGTDPAGQTVEASFFDKAMQFDTAGATGSVVRGLGFAHYGSNWDFGKSPAMVVGTAPNLVFENNTFAWGATRGLSVYSTGARVTANTFLYNGFAGLQASGADGLLMEQNVTRYSNIEHFSVADTSVAGAAGTKVSRTSDAVFNGNIAEDNYGNGLWLDESCLNSTVVNNLVRRNQANGVFVELSDNTIVASNVSADNGRLGLKVSGSTDVRAWNNTLANNGTSQIGVYEDVRTNTNSAEVLNGITWDTARVDVVNNILASDDGRATGPLLHTHDGNSPKKVGAADMLSTLDANAYARKSASSPTVTGYWAILLSPFGTNYSTLSALRTATGREVSGWSQDGYAVSPLFVDGTKGNYALLSTAPVRGTGRALPADIASAVGIAAGASVNRGALVWPAAPTNPTPTTTTTVPAPTTTTSTTTLVAPNTSVYGVMNVNTGDHVYTRNSLEVTSAQSLYGYTSLGVVFRSWSTPGAGRVPVYRLSKPAGAGHLYTVWASERDSAVATYGFSYEGVAFYGSRSASGLVPIYRYWCSSTSDHRLGVTSTAPSGCVTESLQFWAGQ